MNSQLAIYPSHPKPPLIDKPSRQNGHHRQFFLALTALAWAMWFYLWTPLFAAVSYIFGISSFKDTSPLLSGSVSLLFLLGISAGCFLLTLGWVNYKKILRAWKKPKTPRSGIPWAAIMDQQGLDAKSVNHLSIAPSALIHFDELGTPLRVLAQRPLLKDKPPADASKL